MKHRSIILRRLSPLLTCLCLFTIGWLVHLINYKSGGEEKEARATSVVIPTDEEIADAYAYLYGRYLLTRQENHDILIEQAGYNAIKYNPPGFYTSQMSDEWGEVISNINERNYSQTSNNKIALLLKSSGDFVTGGEQPGELPATKIKILARVEVKGRPTIAQQLQRQFTLTVPDGIKIDSLVLMPYFNADKPVGSALFDKVEEVLTAYPDFMPRATAYQASVRKVAAYRIGDDSAKRRVQEIVATKAIPEFFATTRRVEK